MGKNNFNNFGNNKNQKKLNNNNNNFNRNNDGINSVYKYLASQGLSLANKGIVRINNCDNTVRFEDKNGNITPGKLDDKGKFLPFNKSGKSLDKKNRGIDSFNPDLSDEESSFIKSQYKMLCCSDNEDIYAALQSSDTKILVGACIAAAEFNLDVNDRLIDLLNHEEDIVSQSARKGLLIQSFYLLSKIKRINSQNDDYFRGKPSPENLLKYTSGKKLEIGKDYVDFGPLPSEDNIVINNAVLRWQVWFKRNDSKLRDTIKDPTKK